MRTGEAEILFVPGLGEADDDHWITRWESRLPTGRRVAGVESPRDFDAWVARIREAVGQAAKPVVIVAHSLGATAVAHAAEAFPAGVVRGAFLVSAPSGSGLQSMIARDAAVDPAVAPPPRAPLPFPSLLVASRDDPHSAYEDVAEMALDWGAQIVDAGPAGHIDPSSGHGPWPEGLMRFGAFLARI